MCIKHWNLQCFLSMSLNVFNTTLGKWYIPSLSGGPWGGGYHIYIYIYELYQCGVPWVFWHRCPGRPSSQRDPNIPKEGMRPTPVFRGLEGKRESFVDFPCHGWCECSTSWAPWKTKKGNSRDHRTTKMRNIFIWSTLSNLTPPPKKVTKQNTKTTCKWKAD